MDELHAWLDANQQNQEAVNRMAQHVQGVLTGDAYDPLLLLNISPDQV